MKEKNLNIGKNLKKMRKHRGLTIDELSCQSDVSKSMISEIERGIRNPSITIIWKLANSLKKPLNYFLKENNMNKPMIYKMGDKQGVVERGYTFHPLMDFDEDKKFEIYFNEYLPESVTESSYHFEGVEEYVLVTRGDLTVNIDQEEFTIKEGEVLHFSADKPHNYLNKSEEITKAFVLIFYTE